jgi:WD40 repeat protein/tRNA A-37 threonylcarbamoyl transferase component Bud32
MATADRLIEIFHDAKARPTGEERDRFLAEACAGHAGLKQKVINLLQAHEASGDFLEPTAISAGIDFTEKPGDVLGRYKLRETLGEGGCGVVYVADQAEPVRRRVALKVIKLGMDTKAVVARFEAERQALAMMDHPNIAKVFDAGATETGRPYFVMELVRGVRITDYCDQGRLSTRERLELFIKVCQAIQHAHQKGIIHRDIKPSNILVTLHDGVPVPKVIDFGIAKATEGRLTDVTVYTQLHQFMGTPAYMSPEQAEMSGLDIDTRSDIYSLGVLLYELLSGGTPFDPQELMSRGLDAMRRTIREKEPLRPSTRLANLRGEELTTTAKRRGADAPKLIHLVKGDLDWIVMKCLEKDRSRRYDTANGLALDLQRHLNNEPVSARPPSAVYRFQKAFRRNKVLFTAAGAVAATLVTGIGVSWWQAFVARKAQRTAEIARNGELRQRLTAESAQSAAETERERANAQARKASENEQQSRRLLYASDMNLAQQALKLNNLGKARRLLERHRPQPGEEDLRGWEWRYLWQLTRSSAFATLTNRPTPGFSISFSPDGRRLAVGWFNGRVDLWDVPGRRLIRALTDRECPYQGRVAFAPVGNLLAATSKPQTVTLYNLDSGQESILWRAPAQGGWDVRDLAFSQDGSKAVVYAGLPASFTSRPTDGLVDSVWVINVSTGRVESEHHAVYSANFHFGAARFSPDAQRLYLARADSWNYRYSIQCLDLATGQELWQTEAQRDYGVTTLAVSPEGRVLASGSGFEDPAIRIWDAATGRLLFRLDGHTAWVCRLSFSKDGRQLISAASDQTIRVWDTRTWTETRVLRGHADEVYAVAISEPAQLVASLSKDGDLMLWKDDGRATVDGYTRLPDNLRADEVWPLNHCGLLCLPRGKQPELLDLASATVKPSDSLRGLESSEDVLGFFGTNILCHWDGSRILVRELLGEKFAQRGAFSLECRTRPTGVAYQPGRQLLAWAEKPSSTSVYLASLAAPGRRVELRSDVLGLVPLFFSQDGDYLVAAANEDRPRRAWGTLRAWKVESGQMVASIDGVIRDATLTTDGRTLVLAITQGNDHEIRFCDLAHPDRPPRSFPGKGESFSVTVSPEGGLVAAGMTRGSVRLFDPARQALIESVHGHLNAVFGLAFSPDGRRLISASGGREAIKLWDVRTRQELLTLPGTGSALLTASWSPDGNVMLAGTPWQAWRAPSWEEIAEAEAKEKAETIGHK